MDEKKLYLIYLKEIERKKEIVCLHRFYGHHPEYVSQSASP